MCARFLKCSLCFSWSHKRPDLCRNGSYLQRFWMLSVFEQRSPWPVSGLRKTPSQTVVVMKYQSYKVIIDARKVYVNGESKANKRCLGQNVAYIRQTAQTLVLKCAAKTYMWIEAVVQTSLNNVLKCANLVDWAVYATKSKTIEKTSKFALGGAKGRVFTVYVANFYQAKPHFKLVKTFFAAIATNYKHVL